MLLQFGLHLFYPVLYSHIDINEGTASIVSLQTARKAEMID